MLFQLEDRTVPANLITVQTGGLAAIPAGASTFADTNDYVIDPSALNTAVANVVLRANTSLDFLAAVSISNTGVSLDAEAKDGLSVQAVLATAAGGNVRLSGTAVTRAIGLNIQTNLTAGGNVVLLGTGGDEGGGFDAGVSVAGTVSAAGTMSVNGHGGTGFFGSNPGINIDGSLVSNGDLTLVGVGGAGGFSSGVIAFTNLTSTTGTVSITGTGGTGSTEADGINVGVFLFNTVVTAGGAVGVILDGTGGNGPVGSNDGVLFSTATVNATAGPVVATGRAGFGDDSFGIRHSGGDTKAPHITLISDTLDIDSSSRLTASGTSTIVPLTAAQSIVLGGADSMTALGLTDIEFDRFFTGTLRVGSATAGSIASTAAVNPANTTRLELTTGNAITGGSGGTDVTVANLMLTAVNGIGTSGPRFMTAVGTLAATNAGLSGIAIAELDDVSILGLSAANGSIVFDSGETATLIGPVNAPGNSVAFNTGAPLVGKELVPAVAGVDITSATATVGLLLNITLGGNVPDTQYSRLVASGTLDLSNASLVFSGAYSPAAGEVFTIVSAATLTGEFAGFANNYTFDFGGRTLRLNYTPTAVTLTALPRVSLSLSSSSGIEAGTTVITVTATAESAVSGDQSVQLAGTGSASALDYALSNATIAILDGQSSGSVTFTVVNDAIDEDDETALLTISNPTNGILLGAVITQSITIVDDDTAGITIAPTSTLRTTESAGTATFNVVLNSQPTADVVIQLSSSNANEGTLGTTSLTFTPANWNVPQTVVVTGVNDDTVDGPIPYTIISTPANSGDAKYVGINPVDIALTNNDNDTASLNVLSRSFSETDGDFVTTFTVTLDTAVTGGFDVAISSLLGTAEANDYTLDTTSLHFDGLAGELKTIFVTIKGDRIVEGDETFQLRFGAISNTTLAGSINTDAFAIATIANDDATTLTISGQSRSENGGPITFTVASSNAVEGGFTIDFATQFGTAGATDFTARSGTLAFAGLEGESKSFQVALLNDAIVESGETFGASVSNVAGLSGGIQPGNFAAFASATGTILDDDAPTILVVPPGQGVTGTQVLVFDANTQTRSRSIVPFPGFQGALSTALADFTGDGIADIVVGAGAGGGSHVKLFDGVTGLEQRGFFAFASGFTGGVSLAVGDVNGDGLADFIVGAGPGGGPNVKAFHGRSGQLLADFFAGAAAFEGGVKVAAGDVTGDGLADIITATGTSSQVKVFAAATGLEIRSVSSFNPAFTGGVNVAAGDVTGDGSADLIVGAGPGGGPQVNVYDGRSGREVGSFFAYALDFSGGVDVAANDVNADGLADVVTGAGPGGGPHVKAFGSRSFGEVKSFFATDLDFLGGVLVG